MLILKIILFLFLSCLAMGLIGTFLAAIGFKDDDMTAALALGVVVAIWIVVGVIKALGGIARFLEIIAYFSVPLLSIGILWCLCVIFARLKRKSYLKQLAYSGIIAAGKINANEKMWRKLEKKGVVRKISSGYLLSSQFYGQTTQEIDQFTVLSENELQDIFSQKAPCYDSIYNDVLLAILQERHHLLMLSDGMEDTRYLSKKFVAACEHLVNVEGAVTKGEFAKLCSESDVTTCLHSKSRQLADAIIENMISTSKVNIRPLETTHENLYVSKNPDTHSKMTRVELTL